MLGILQGENPPRHRAQSLANRTKHVYQQCKFMFCSLPGQINSWPLPMSLWIEPKNTGHLMMP